MAQWKWQVTCYYASDVQPPKQPGELAIQTVHKDDVSKDMEVRAARDRADIGHIDVAQLRT